MKYNHFYSLVCIGDTGSTMNKLLYELCEKGDVLSVQCILNQPKKRCYYNWKVALGRACQSGCLTLVKLITENVCHDFGYSKRRLGQGGSLKILEYLISKGVQDYFWVFVGACEFGHLDMIKFLINNHFIKNEDNSYLLCEGIRCATKNGHDNIVDYLCSIYISLGNTTENIAYYKFIGACIGGRVELVKKYINDCQGNFLTRGSIDAENILKLVCESGSVESVQFVVNRFSLNNWNRGLYVACRQGHFQVALMMIEYGANDYNQGLYMASEGGHLQICQHMVSLGATHLSGALCAAAFFGHLDVAVYLLHCGATVGSGQLRDALEGCHYDIAQLMIEKGILDKDVLKYMHLEQVAYCVQNGTPKELFTENQYYNQHK